MIIEKGGLIDPPFCLSVSTRKFMVLIIKHIDIERPGTLGDFFVQKEIPFRIVELGAGERLPTDLKDIRAVVVLGGPMNVYEEDKYPFLKEENIFIQRVLKEQIPYFGICLGAQLLAKAAGARVVRSPIKEVGWYKVSLTSEGKKDPLLIGFNQHEDVYHWHGDMFEVPANGVLLATADGCPHQAFRVGKNAYGFQFHMEVTDKSIKEWCDEYSATDLPGRKEHCETMLAQYVKNKGKFDRQANRLYENFLNILEDRELLQQHIENLKQSIQFFSNTQKSDREKWVVRNFLLNLGMVFSESELVVIPNDPPDIQFHQARFEVKELMEDTRKRDAEFKAALEKAMNAKTFSELWEKYTPPEESSFEGCVSLMNKKLNDISYGLDVCQQTDLLFYVNLQDVYFLFPEDISQYLVQYEKDWSKWRSLAFVTNSNVSGVLFAQNETPSFIKSMNKKTVRRSMVNA